MSKDAKKSAPAAPKAKACTICGAGGHNKRSCPKRGDDRIVPAAKTGGGKKEAAPKPKPIFAQALERMVEEIVDRRVAAIVDRRVAELLGVHP